MERTEWQQTATDAQSRCSGLESELQAVSSDAAERISAFEAELEMARQKNNELQVRLR